jgi:hypothetical protein
VESVQRVAERTFVETTGPGTYTATVVIPAGGTITEIIWRNTALWTASTSAVLNVRTEDQAGEFIADYNIKVGPSADAAGVGGLCWGPISGLSKYCAAEKTVTATVVTVGETGDAGRSRLLVLYSVPTPVAATKA